jgi:hypothetical protein
MAASPKEDQGVNASETLVTGGTGSQARRPLVMMARTIATTAIATTAYGSADPESSSLANVLPPVPRAEL